MIKKFYIYMENCFPHCIYQVQKVDEKFLRAGAGAGLSLEENVIRAIKEGYEIILDKDSVGVSQPLPKDIKDKILLLINKK